MTATEQRGAVLDSNRPVDNSNATNMGNFYWCVETASGERVYLYADKVEVREGVLTFSSKRAQFAPVMGFAPGHWVTFYSAGATSNRPLSVRTWLDRWRGEASD